MTDRTREPVPLDVAAARLGLTIEGVRKRIVRGQLDGYKGPRGKWFVILPSEEFNSSNSDTDSNPSRSDISSNSNSSIAPTEPDGATYLTSLVLAALQPLAQQLEASERQAAEQDRAYRSQIRELRLQLQQQVEHANEMDAKLRRIRELLEERRSKKPWWRFW